MNGNFIQKVCCFMVIAVLSLGFIGVGPAYSVEHKYLVNVDDNGVALQEFDAVGFFKQHQAILGYEKYQSEYGDAIYYFSTQKNKKSFDKSPGKYAPQFGGFCAVAMSMGKLERVSINTWDIVKGKLYFQANAKAKKMWDTKGPEFFIAKAEKNWPAAVEKYGKSTTHK